MNKKTGEAIMGQKIRELERIFRKRKGNKIIWWT